MPHAQAAADDSNNLQSAAGIGCGLVGLVSCLTQVANANAHQPAQLAGKKLSQKLLLQPELKKTNSHHTAASRPATAWRESFGGALRKNTQRRDLLGSGATLAEPEVFERAFFRPTAQGPLYK
jgi:hypothetical protein